MIDRQKKLMDSFINFVFVIFLFSQIFFNHTIISQFAMLIMTLIVVILCLLKKKFYFGFYFIFVICFIIQSYISSINGISIDAQTSIKMTITIVLNLIISLAVYNYILIYDNLEKTLVYFAKIVLYFTFIIIIFSFGNITKMRLGSDVSFNILGNVVDYNSNTIALLSGFSYLIFIYKYNKEKSKTDIFKIVWFIFIILLSGSRKGLFILILGTPLLIYLLNPKKRIKNIFISSLVIIILYLAIIKTPLFYNIIGNRVEAYVNILFGAEVNEASANTRELFIERGWNYFLQKPWTGYGLDCFRHLSGSYGTYSHNNYIELLVSGGIPTLILYYFIRIIVLIKLFINRNLDSINKLLFVILLLLIISEYGLVSYFDRLFAILFIFILCGYKKIKEKKLYAKRKK